MARHSGSTREGLGFGLLLIALGAVLLLNQLGYVDWSLGRLWPLFVIAFGLLRVASWRSPRRIGNGVMLMLFGCWFLIAVNEWHGLGWEESWPLALVAVGAGIIVRALLRRFWASGSDPDDYWHKMGGRGGDASGSAGGAQ